MDFIHFDMTFCRGVVEFEQNGILATMTCPVRDKCRRFWTEAHAEKATETGNIYNSFYLLTDPNDLTDAGCDNFLGGK